MTFGEAVAELMHFHTEEGLEFDCTVEAWLDFVARASFDQAQEKARSMGIDAIWDCELARTPEGCYQVRGGVDYAVVKSLAVAPFTDLIWEDMYNFNKEERAP